MKIESITFIEAGSVPFQTRNTKSNEAVKTIMENLAKAPTGKWMVINASDVKKFERYALQKTLQKKGAKVLVSNGTNPQTGKPALLLRKLNDKEWADWVKG